MPLKGQPYRDYMRAYMRRRRAEKREAPGLTVNPVNPPSPLPVNPVNPPPAPLPPPAPALDRHALARQAKAERIERMKKAIAEGKPPSGAAIWRI